MLINRLLLLLARGVPRGMRLPIVRGPLRGGWWISGAAAGEGRGLSRRRNPEAAAHRRVGAQVTARRPDTWYAHATSIEAFTSRKKPASRGSRPVAPDGRASAQSPAP